MKTAKKSARRRTPLDIVVSRNVLIWRLANGMTQLQVANRLAVTFQQYQKYESGLNRIATGRLVKLAQIFGVPVAVLLQGADTADASHSLLVLIADKRAFRLAVAFDAIGDEDARVSIVNLVEKIAKHVPQRPRRRSGQRKGR